MKSIRTFIGCLFIFIASSDLLSAQDSIVIVTAQAQGLNLVSPSDLPDSGTFWMVTSNDVFSPNPCPPQDASLPVFQITDGQFLVDATGGQVATDDGQSVEDALAALANDVQNLISQLQGTTPSRNLSRGGAHAMDDMDPNDPGDGDTNSYIPNVVAYYTPTTNDLWLQITSLSNYTASLIIHRPWNDTNLSHDLYYTESLTQPVQWQFVMRCPYTNAVVTDLCMAPGFFRLGQATNGNLTVSTNFTPQQLAQMLVPPWITPLNAKFTGTNVARGMFAGGNGCGLPLENGVILSSGQITNAIGPNNDDGSIAADNGSSSFHTDGIYNGDPDLDSLVGGSGTEDAAVLEFDIFSTNSFTLQFQYVFASEEYPEWIGQYNDPMAVFVSTNLVSTNWINNIPNDLALVPGTTNVPVSVNTISGGLFYNGSIDYAPTNMQFYVDNHDPTYSAVPPYGVAAPVFNIQYDGMTVLLTAQTFINAGVTNHIKIAIADYNDSFYDSAIFLGAWTASFCQ